MHGYLKAAVFISLLIVMKVKFTNGWFAFETTSAKKELSNDVKTEEAITNHMDYITLSNMNVKGSLTEIFGSIVNKKEFELHNILSAILLGVETALFGHSLHSLYIGGITRGSLSNIIVMTFTSIGTFLTMSYKEKFSNIIQLFEKGSETFLERIWSSLTFQTEEITRAPLQEQETILESLKMFIPKIYMSKNTFNYKKIIEMLVNKIRPEFRILIPSCIYGFITANILIYIYDSFSEEDIMNNSWTLQEYLEGFKDNEELYQDLEEWLTPEKQRRHNKQNDIPLDDMDENCNQYSIASQDSLGLDLHCLK